MSTEPDPDAEIDRISRPWADAMLETTGERRPFDAHTHIGQNDPDGYRQTPAELVAGLDPIGARALTFPMHEPGGYPAANDFAIATAAESGGRVAALARIDPRDDALAEARRCLDAGAVGFKFHPRAERFGLDEPGVHAVVELASEARAPVLIHAGRGIPALGRHAIELADRHPGARLILAHAAVSDLGWIWREIGARENVFVDTSWWNPADMEALFSLVPPGRIVWASDSPYGRPALSFATHMRYAVEACISPDGLVAIARGNIEAILAGDGPLDVGRAPGVGKDGEPSPRTEDPVLARVASHLTSAITAIASGGDPTEALSLAELACVVEESSRAAEVCEAVLGVLAEAEKLLGRPDESDIRLPHGTQLVMHAICLARTPSVPLPERRAVEPATS
ncbi:amidohydrolase family protein [Thermoleophilia bacterium SCSIO 60948]|nr:amidohydrolase family protein [Thermoleophilia bacterium SCSIO 60948]